MSLEEIIIREIHHNGPMTVADFMAMALGHPQYGYYMKQDPLGASGDFTTAPEISQIFGELTGAWAADIWMKLGQPSPCFLVEAGPGRGTLMTDILRATGKVPGFHGAVSLHLIETSPVLRKIQRETLSGYDVQWHDRLEDLPAGAPVILIANEFLDALPVRQFQKQDGIWQERVIGLNENQALVWGRQPASRELIPQPVRNSADSGDVLEVSPARERFVASVADHLAGNRGAALFIDYGHERTAAGDTFQAVRNHDYADALEHIGDSDLTSHVDFQALTEGISRESVRISGPVRQGAFLEALGLALRAKVLKKNAAPAQARSIDAAVHRLTHPDEMGTLFKVMALSAPPEIIPAGFGGQDG